MGTKNKEIKLTREMNVENVFMGYELARRLSDEEKILVAAAMSEGTGMEFVDVAPLMKRMKKARPFVLGVMTATLIVNLLLIFKVLPSFSWFYIATFLLIYGCTLWTAGEARIVKHSMLFWKRALGLSKELGKQLDARENTIQSIAPNDVK